MTWMASDLSCLENTKHLESCSKGGDGNVSVIGEFLCGVNLKQLAISYSLLYVSMRIGWQQDMTEWVGEMSHSNGLWPVFNKHSNPQGVITNQYRLKHALCYSSLFWELLLSLLPSRTDRSRNFSLSWLECLLCLRNTAWGRASLSNLTLLSSYIRDG